MNHKERIATLKASQIEIHKHGTLGYCVYDFREDKYQGRFHHGLYIKLGNAINKGESIMEGTQQCHENESSNAAKSQH